MQTKLLPMIAFALLATSSLANAAGCEDYPFIQGINVEDVNGGTRIISTAVVSVSFDDIDAIKDARDEATIEAKSLISAFMSEGISSSQTIDRAVRETKSMQGDSKAGLRNEVIERVKRLRSSTQGMLRGVVPLGECYTKGKEFRSSVGIKPETIAAAERLSNPLPNQPTDSGGSATAAPTRKPLSGEDSSSDTERLKKF